MIYVSNNYLLEVQPDSNWGGTLYYLYEKKCLNDSGIKKPAFNIYSMEYEGDDEQVFKELRMYLNSNSPSPDEDLRDIMMNAVGITEERLNRLLNQN